MRLDLLMRKKKSDAVLVYSIIAAAVALGLLVSSNSAVSVKIGILFIVMLIVFFFVDSLSVVLLLLFFRPVIDPFSTTKISGDINLLSLFSVLFIFLCLFYAMKHRKWDFATGPISLYYIFLIVAFFAVMNSVNFSESVMYFIRFFSLLAIYLLIYNVIVTQNDALKALWAIVLSSIMPILYGYYQMMSHTGIADVGINRLNSTFVHPNMFAFYLVIVFNTIISLYFLEKEIHGESSLWFKAILSVFILVQLLFTYTRGAWIGIVAGLFIIGVQIRKSRVWIIVLLALTVTIFSGQIVLRISDLIDPPSTPYYMSSWEFRIKHWTALFENTLEQRPFLGYGPGQSLYAASRSSQFSGAIPHNDYLRVFVELGVLGLVPFLLFWGDILLDLMKKIREHFYPEFNVSMFGLIVALLISSFADNLIYSISVVGYLFALLAANHKLGILAKIQRDS